MDYAELEIGLYRADAVTYQVELRFADPGNEAEVAEERAAAPLDPAALLGLTLDPEAYGQSLTGQLFQADNVKALYGRARAAVEAADLLLRLRLRIGASAPELHALRWELLRDPQDGTPLATSEKTIFSRFVRSRDWRPVRLRPKDELTALVAVAAPSDIEEYGMSPVDRDGEIARARENLREIAVTVIEAPMTLERLVAGLRQGVDVLYLVCHGALGRRTREPALYLEDDAGRVAVVKGADLALRVAELPRPPRLAVLASCESAGTEAGADAAGQAFAPSSLAPRLADAGVPAVLAMQGRISMETVAEAMPVFFSELLRDGRIDRALAVARGVVRGRDDSWMPALYLRLRSGRLWYEPGFAGEGSDFEKWKSICRRVRQGKCIPILGPNVGEHVFGTAGDLAGRMAAEHGFPLAAHERSDLAKVAQYLSVDQDPGFARDEVLKQLRAQVLERNRDLLDDAARQLAVPALLEVVGKLRRQEEGEPFRVLAELAAPVYVTASAETLLYKALEGPDRKPVALVCDWRPTAENHPQEPAYDGVPAPERPVVYHVFGVFGKPDSLVLTEDDFFDYLIAASTYKLLPAVVRGSLTESSLLFLGFRLESWTFRVLFRLIMTLEGAAGLKQYSHVGVQVDPEEHDYADVERARRFLESYFAKDRGAGRGEPRIDVYWGTAADFLKELAAQLDAVADDEVPAASTEDGGGWF